MDESKEDYKKPQYHVNVKNLSYVRQPRLINQAVDLIREYGKKVQIEKVVPFLKVKPAKDAPLHSVTFKARARLLTGIIGVPSERNALIELLAGRKKSGKVDGSIALSGAISSTDYYYDHVAYVQKKALYVPGLTYEEMLRYSARLRIGYSNKTFINSTITARVEELIDIMNLGHCRHRSIAEYPSLHGVEGCELRRLCIAMEIIVMQPVIIIDDPTLDFDSGLAVGIIKCLKRLCVSGHTVICSYEKPNTEVFLQTDEVVLLSEGYSIFSGPISHVEKHFVSSEMGYVRPMKSNAADLVDFTYDIVTGVERPVMQRAAEPARVMQEKFECSPFFVEPDRIDSVTAFHPNFFYLWGYSIGFSFILHNINRSVVITERAIHGKLRDSEVLRSYAGGILLMGGLLGYLQYGQGKYGYYCASLLSLPYPQTANICSLLFFLTAFSFAIHVLQLHVIVQKVQLFRYEQSANCMSWPAFLLGTIISELPFSVVTMVAFMNVIYWLVGLNLGVNKYFFFMFLAIFNNMVGVLICFFLSAAFKKEKAVREVFITILLIMVLMSGFPFQISTMEDWVHDLAQLVPLRWTFEAMMIWKFSAYDDGLTYLIPFSFATFTRDKVFEILFNFCLVTVGFLVVALMPEPITLVHLSMKTKSATEEMTTSPISGDRGSRGGRESMDSVDDAEPIADLRQSQSVMPVVFMRDSSVTGRASKLSINVNSKSVNEAADDHGPTIVFHHVTYRVRDRTSPMGYKSVLDHVTGQFEWGKLSMIMGAAKSGKSTLLHVLAGDKGIATELSGDILFNGQPVHNDEKQPLHLRCGLVDLENDQLGGLTVRDIVSYAFMLRCTDMQQLNLLEESVEVTLALLHLEGVANLTTKQLKAGEIKRLSIAEEMVMGPSLLLMDEPLNGLNISDQALLMSTFRELVNGDRTVVATVDNPTKAAFNLFDTLMLLSMGKVIYYGPVSEAASFFENSPFQFNFHTYNNPADYLTDISAGQIAKEDGVLASAKEVEQYFKNTIEYDRIRKLFNDKESKAIANTLSDTMSPMAKSTDSRQSCRVSTDAEILMKTKEPLPTVLRAVVILFEDFLCTGPPSFVELRQKFFRGRVLIIRSFKSLYSRFDLVLISFVVHIVIAILFGLLMGDCSSGQVYDLTSFFAMGSFLVMFAVLQCVPYIYECNKVFLKENARSLYSAGLFWTVNSMSLYLLRALNAIVFATIIYNMVNLTDDQGIEGFFILNFILLNLSATTMAEALVASSANLRIVYMTLPAVCFLQFIFSGLFLKFQSLPSWLGPWAPSISMIRWSMQGLFLNQFSYRKTDSACFATLPSGYSTYTALLNLFGWGGKTCWFCARSLALNIPVYKTLALIGLAFAAVAQKGGRKFKRSSPEETEALVY